LVTTYLIARLLEHRFGITRHPRGGWYLEVVIGLRLTGQHKLRTHYWLVLRKERKKQTLWIDGAQDQLM